MTSIDTSKASLGKAWVLETTGTFETTPIGVELRTSALDDYDLTCKAFSNFLYLADVSKLLAKPLKTKRQKALDCFIRVSQKHIL